jgi:hypothetical protein
MALTVRGWTQQPDGSWINKQGYHAYASPSPDDPTGVQIYAPDGSPVTDPVLAEQLAQGASVAIATPTAAATPPPPPAATPSPLASLAPHATPQPAVADVPAAVAAQQEGFGKANQGGLPQPLAPGQQGPPQQPQGPTQGPTPFTYGLSGNLATPQPTPTATPRPAPQAGPSPTPTKATPLAAAGNVPALTDPTGGAAGYPGVQQVPKTTASPSGLDLLGYDPVIAYQQYLSSVQNVGSWAPIQVGVLGFNDWFTGAVQSAGTVGVQRAISLQIQEATGKPVSQKQLDQIMQVIRGLPADVTSEILAAAGQEVLAGAPTTGSNSLGSVISRIGPLNDLLGTMTGGLVGSKSVGGVPTTVETVAQVEAAAALARRDKVINSFESQLGRAPTPDELNSLQNAPAQTLTDALANAPYKDGMTFKEYTDIQSQMDTAYLKYYGRAATPQEIAWGAGKSNDAIQSHLMQGDSRVQGINLGTFLNYESALSPISQQLYGNSADDHIIADFHQSLQAQGKDFTPVINPKGGS